RMHGVELFAKAVFESDGHHHAGGEAGGEQQLKSQPGFDLLVPFGAGLRREPLRVVALRKGNRRRDAAEPVILVEQPVSAKIPPLRAVEDVVEAGAGKRRYLVRRMA